MRIVLLNQYFAPDEAATAQLLADLGQGLAAAGHDVVAICSRRAYENPGLRYRGRERLRGVDVRRVPTTGFGRGSAIGRSLDYLTFVAGATLALLLGAVPLFIWPLESFSGSVPLLAMIGASVAALLVGLPLILRRKS